MEEVDSVAADGAEDVGADVDLVHVVVTLHDAVLVVIPELVHAWVGGDWLAFALESDLLLDELDLLFTGTRLQLSFNPGVQVHSSDSNEQLEDAYSGIPPSKELVTERSVIGVVDFCCCPGWESDQLDHEGHENHVIVEPENTKE